MVEACKAAGVPEPQYGTDGLFVWITFKRPDLDTNLDINLDTYSDTYSDTNSDSSSDSNLVTNLDTNLVTNLVTNSDSSSDSSSDSNLLLSDRQKEVLFYCISPRSSREILEHIGVTFQQKNREKFINTLVDAGLLERTQPDSLNSPNQKYVIKRK